MVELFRIPRNYSIELDDPGSRHTMGTTITARMMRRIVARYRRSFLTAAPLLLVLLVSACATSNGAVTRPTATPAADKQDIIATPAGGTATASVVTPTPLSANAPAAPSAAGRVILVSLSRQQLYAYEYGTLTFTFLVETGRPELPTPTGVFHVFVKNCSDRRWTSNVAPTAAHNATCAEHNGDGHQAMFTSPWPA